MKKINLKFYNNVKPLHLKDYKYWRKLLSKVLKVGAELEFNLNQASGNCRGYSSTCLCPALETGECVPTCIFLGTDGCKLNIRNTVTCENATSRCISVQCESCNNFKFKCGQSFCIHFMPQCLVCERPTARCNTCPSRYDSTKTSDHIRRSAEVELDATQNFGYVGKHGVLQVVRDGSLKNQGLEIPTVGRRLNFEVFKEMFSNILAVAKKSGGYSDDRCSFHVHILNEYYTKVNNCHGASRHPDNDVHLNLTSFEKKMPSIILTNIIQLWRYYETAIYWMGCGLPDPNHATRWEKFRVSLLKTSPIFMSVSDMLTSIGNDVGKKRYGSLNLSNTKLDGSRLHLEFRVCDMITSESYMTAMCCLFYCIVMKAVDISCYGLLNVEDAEWLAKEQSIKHDFINGACREYSDNRLSDTANLYKHTEYLSSKALELIDLLSPILSGFDPAKALLQSIAQKPIALRLAEKAKRNNLTLCEVTDTYDIEKDLTSILTDKDILSEIEEKLLKTIALGEIHGCGSIQDWISEISSDNNIPTGKIEEHIN